MFDMTNDSHLFRTRRELEEKEGAWPIGGNRFQSAAGEWVPLYEGKMVQAYDHRAASVVVNLSNQHRPAQPRATLPKQYGDPSWLPEPQYWINDRELPIRDDHTFLTFKDVTAPTNIRSMIATLIPRSGVGNTLPIVILDENHELHYQHKSIMLAQLNALLFDYIARQKIQGQHLNWYIVEQLPVIPPERFESTLFGPKSAAQIVREAVLELTYTARDLGHVDDAGNVRPPFVWDEHRRLRLRAKLDAVFFHLYGITDREDIRYIYSTFPIQEREEQGAHGTYLSRDLCLAWVNALAAGTPDADIAL